MDMKKLVSSVAAFTMTASVFASLAVNASAAEGDVPAIYTEDFETVASYGAESVYRGTVFGIEAEGLGTILKTKALKIGSSASGSGKGTGYKKSLTDNTEAANALSSYKNAVIDFDFESLQVRSDRDANTRLGFADSDGSMLFDLTVGTGKNWGTNTLTDASGESTSVPGKALHFTMELDFLANTQKITAKDLNGTAADVVIERTGIKQKDFAGFYYPNTTWTYGYFLVDNLTVTTKEIAVETADYTVKYVCGDTVLKTDTCNGVVGDAPNVTMDDIETDGKKYACSSTDLGDRTILSDGSLVVTVTCAEIPAVTEAVVNYAADGVTVASETVTIADGSFEGESYDIPYRRYVAKDGVLYQAAANAQKYTKSVTLTSATVLDITVTAVAVPEGETFIAVADGDGDSGNNADIRASNASAARGTLTIADVQPGIYKIDYQGYIRKTGNGPELYLDDTSLGVLEQTCSGWTNVYTQGNITVTAAGTLAIHNCSMMDTVVLYKTGEYSAPTLPTVAVAEGGVYSTEGSTPAKVFTGTFTVGENNISVKAVDWKVKVGDKVGEATSTFDTVLTNIEVVTGLVVEYADAANLTAENVTATCVAAAPVEE